VPARFALPPLPFAPDALEPAISAATFAEHHGGHHRAYVEALNRLAGEGGMAGAGLLDIVRTGRRALFDNAAQHFNHAFFWKSLSPARQAPAGRLAAMITRDFGGLDALKARLVESGAAHFASGWVWLVKRRGGLAVVATHDADTPVRLRTVLPLLVVDLWEHAYYLDHRRDRRAFLEAVVEQHLDWSFAARMLEAGAVEALAGEIGIANGAAD